MLKLYYCKCQICNYEWEARKKEPRCCTRCKSHRWNIPKAISNKCQHCYQRKKLIGHHYDYSNPLQVIWLCRSCHSKIHLKRNRKEK